MCAAVFPHDRNNLHKLRLSPSSSLIMFALLKAKTENQGMEIGRQSFMLRLREALEASWRKDTSFMAVEQAGNAALGQCYPTSRIVQHFYPETEIVKGLVRTGNQRDDVHFWNALPLGNDWYHIDMSWRQFASGAEVTGFTVLNRYNLNDSDMTVRRVDLLLERVKAYLAQRGADFEPYQPDP